ncbi:hypothetical protein EDB19DRAFT_1826200 [Suillus lakei]|nr:hypothetical protein EDB19DRAFT_1826200 [Suillus lakei]
MTINLCALSTRASGLVDNILDPHHQHHDDMKPGTHGMDPYELLQAITSLKPANYEANLVMDLARAKREVLRAQKALAECLLQENEVLASLLRLRVDTAENTLDDADMGLGYSMAGLIVPYLQNNVKVISAPLLREKSQMITFSLSSLIDSFAKDGRELLFGLELLDFQMQSPAYAALLYFPFVGASLANLPNDTSIIYTLDASDRPSCNNTRMLWGILLSCGFKDFTCMHNAHRLQFIRTFWLVGARRAAKDFNDDVQRERVPRPASIVNITLTDLRQSLMAGYLNMQPMTHGLFAWMSEFMLYISGKLRATLTPDELQRFFHVEDRSKGDVIIAGKTKREEMCGGSVHSHSTLPCEFVPILHDRGLMRGRGVIE